MAGHSDDLIGNEEFVTQFTELTRAALGTHLEEKLDLLQLALRRTAVGAALSVWATTFLRLVDELEPTEVRLLMILHEFRVIPGEDYPDQKIAHRVSAIKAYLDLPDDEIDLVVQRLETLRLAQTSAALIGRPSYPVALATDLGTSFIEWLEVT